MPVVAVTVLAGVLIGISLGALGGGGSILTVPALVYLVGQDATTATTGSLVIVGGDEVFEVWDVEVGEVIGRLEAPTGD